MTKLTAKWELRVIVDNRLDILVDTFNSENEAYEEKGLRDTYNYHFYIRKVSADEDSIMTAYVGDFD